MSNQDPKQPLLLRDETKLKSPNFTARPGWGGQLHAFVKEVAFFEAVILTVVVVLALFAIRSNSVRTASIQQLIDSEHQSQTGNEGDFVFNAQAGQGLTDLAAKAVDDFVADEKVKIEAVEHLFAVTMLAKDAGWNWINFGREIRFTREAVYESIAKAKELTAIEKTSWSKYLKPLQ